jgi:hypothetical protein
MRLVAQHAWQLRSGFVFSREPHKDFRVRTNLLRIAFVLGVSSLCGSQSRADFVYFLGNPSGYESRLSAMGITDANVLFNAPGLTNAGPVVQGEAHSGSVLDFSSTVSLATPALGQARVTALSGQLFSLSIFADNPNQPFEALSFNVNTAHGEEGALTFTVFGASGATGPVTIEPRSGLTFFGVIASGNDFVNQVLLTASDSEIDDVRQVRIATTGDPGATTPFTPVVPEPNPLVLLTFGACLWNAPRLRRWVRQAHIQKSMH